ncbi:hypothetical protein RQP46_010875 [Phenoliferia psychrophenolica]
MSTRTTRSAAKAMEVAGKAGAVKGAGAGAGARPGQVAPEAAAPSPPPRGVKPTTKDVKPKQARRTKPTSNSSLSILLLVIPSLEPGRVRRDAASSTPKLAAATPPRRALLADPNAILLLRGSSSTSIFGVDNSHRLWFREEEEDDDEDDWEETDVVIDTMATDDLGDSQYISIEKRGIKANQIMVWCEEEGRLVELDPASPMMEPYRETFLLDQRVLLGKGSFGRVYDLGTARKGGVVAIKVLLPPSKYLPSKKYKRTKESDRRRHEAEFILQFKSRHRCVVDVFAIGTLYETGRTFVLLEKGLCDGFNHQPPADPEERLDEALGFMSNLLAGLQHIHSIGLVHRDLKLANCVIFCDPYEDDRFVLKIADFGCAGMAKCGEKAEPQGTKNYGGIVSELVIARYICETSGRAELDDAVKRLISQNDLEVVDLRGQDLGSLIAISLQLIYHAASAEGGEPFGCYLHGLPRVPDLSDEEILDALRRTIAEYRQWQIDTKGRLDQIFAAYPITLKGITPSKGIVGFCKIVTALKPSANGVKIGTTLADLINYVDLWKSSETRFLDHGLREAPADEDLDSDVNSFINSDDEGAEDGTDRDIVVGRSRNEAEMEKLDSGDDLDESGAEGEIGSGGESEGDSLDSDDDSEDDGTEEEEEAPVAPKRSRQVKRVQQDSYPFTMLSEAKRKDAGASLDHPNPSLRVVGREVPYDRKQNRAMWSHLQAPGNAHDAMFEGILVARD